MMYTKEHLEILVRYFHPERKYPFLRGAFSSNAHASLFGIREQLYSRIRDSLQTKMRACVDLKIHGSDFGEKISKLNVVKQSRIVALGDSLTDDLLSWFEMLRYAFSVVRPEDDIEFVNYATTGDNSSQILQSIVETHQLENVSHVFCLIGTNDSRCFGHGMDKPNISLAEFQANIAAVMQFHQRKSSAQWRWLLPVMVDPERISQDPFLQNVELSWDNAQIEAIQKYLHSREEVSIELQSLVTDKTFHEADGLHWTLEAHATVLERVVNNLLQTT